MSKTICQLCSQKRECRMVQCDTEYLHGRNVVRTGHKGKALLSVCEDCGKKHRIGAK